MVKSTYLWPLGKRQGFNLFFKEQKLSEYFRTPENISPKTPLSPCHCGRLEKAVVTYCVGRLYEPNIYTAPYIMPVIP